MSKKCPNCGKLMMDSLTACADCGTPLGDAGGRSKKKKSQPVAPAVQPEAAPAPAQPTYVEPTAPETQPEAAPAPAVPAAQPTYAAPAGSAPVYPSQTAPAQPAYAPPVYAAPVADAVPTGKYKPIGAWGYIGLMLLFAIPVIGLIIAIILACVDKKRNIRNFARATLIVFLIGLILSLVIGVLGYFRVYMPYSQGGLSALAGQFGFGDELGALDSLGGLGGLGGLSGLLGGGSSGIGDLGGMVGDGLDGDYYGLNDAQMEALMSGNYDGLTQEELDGLLEVLGSLSEEDYGDLVYGD